MMRHNKYFLTVLLLLSLSQAALAGVRIKDLTQVAGAQENQLIGYGLVVGLNGTGDKDISTIQAVANMLNTFGLTVNAKDLKLKNTAAVIVTATLPPFAKAGGKIDVTVSSYAGAKSLQGGILLQTPLVGADREVYVVAQGALSIGGFNIGRGGGDAQRNHDQVARVVNGGIVEQALTTNYTDNDRINFILRDPDPQTAVNIAQEINKLFDLPLAQATEPSEVVVAIPPKFSGREVTMLALIGELKVDADTQAVIVINERTGTVVMGENVGISSVAISHGNLSISVKPQAAATDTEAGASEPGQEQGGGAGSSEEKTRVILLEEGSTIGHVVRLLNSIGVAPRDMIAIFQAIRVSGALQADLIIM